MGFGDDNDIKIEVILDSDGAVKAARRIDGELENLGQTAQKSSSAFSKFQANIISINQALDLGQKAFGLLKGAVGEAFDQLQRAQEVEGLSRSFQNLQGGANAAAETLSSVQVATKGLVSEYDIMQQANQAVLLGLPTEGFDELAAAATKLGAATGRTATEALGDLVTGLGRASPLILDNLGITVKAAEAQELYAAKLGKSVDALTEQEKAEAFRAVAIDKILQKNKELADIEETAATATTRFSVAIQDLGDRFATALSQNTELEESINDLSAAMSNIDVEDLAARLAKLLSVVVSLADKMATFAATTQAAFKAVGSTSRINQFKAVSKSIGAISEQFEALNKFGPRTEETLRDLEKRFNFLIRTTSDLNEENLKTPGHYENIQSALSVYSSDIQRLRSELEQQADAQKEVNEEVRKAKEPLTLFTQDIGFINKELDNTAVGFGDVFRNAQKFFELQNRVAQTGGGGNQFGLFGGDGFTIQDDLLNTFNLIGGIGQSVSRGGVASIFTEHGATIGGALGAGLASTFATTGAVAGPIGAAIGLAVGFAVEAFTKDTNNAHTKTRRSVEELMQQAFDANNLKFIIRDELGKVRLEMDDFPFLFTDLGEGTGGLGETLFGSLPAAAQSAFSGVAIAIDQMAGASEVVFDQLALSLTDNLGGSLNNLQVLVQGMGLSFEELEEHMIASALTGKASFLEVQSGLNQIGELAEQGIPGKLGAVEEAFENIASAGKKGGLFSVDALKDIAAEAKELGIETLPELQKFLSENTDLAIEDIKTFFDNLENNGVKTMEELLNASDKLAIQILAGLEASEGFFDETIEKIENVQERLDQLDRDRQINLRFNISSNFQDLPRGEQEALEKGGVQLPQDSEGI